MSLDEMIIATGHGNVSLLLDTVLPSSSESVWDPTTAALEPSGGDDSLSTLTRSVLLGFFLSLLTLSTVAGNMLVILSVCSDRHLHSSPNILIVNLAVADLMVGLFVMPLAIADLVARPWVWVSWKCNLYLSSDVFSCTGSIMTLCMISVDRYMAITRPFKYGPKRTPRLMLMMVLVVWIIGAFIALSPFIWGGNVHGIPGKNICLLSQETVYTIYSTFGAFYLPLVIMLTVYYKIYRAAKQSEKAELQRRPSIIPMPLPISRQGSIDDSSPAHSEIYDRRRSLQKFAEHLLSKARPSLVSIRTNASGKSRISLRVERRAAKTLGVIMGTFTCCWLPFFLLAIVRPFCDGEIPTLLDKTLLWLGYTNSAINPVIYPLFNKDFVQAYKRLIECEIIGGRRRSLYGARDPGYYRANGNSRDKYRYSNGSPPQDLTTSDLINANMADRRPSDLDKISEASEEYVRDV